MPRFQYRVVNLGMFFAQDRMVSALGSMGAAGWELVGIYDKSSNWLQGMEKGFALFKREVADGQDPEGPWADAGYGYVESIPCPRCGAAMKADTAKSGTICRQCKTQSDLLLHSDGAWWTRDSKGTNYRLSKETGAWERQAT